MKTLADVRRRMVPGTRTRIVNHVRPVASGLRIVHKNQSKDIAWRTEDDKITWLKWPKADEIKIEGPDTVTFFVAGNPFLTITFVRMCTDPRHSIPCVYDGCNACEEECTPPKAP